jgi:hypothetical protein
LLFGIRTTGNGFSSQSEEMITAFSIMQALTITPFQNLILNSLNNALTEGGYTDMQLYFEQLTPLVILSKQAEEQDKSVKQVEDETNDSLENPAVSEAETVEDVPDVETEEFEIFKLNK